MQKYRVVVVGVGGIGSAACYWAARSGGGVLGLEKFGLFHPNGGSQDHSRIIRLAQHEEPYASLAPHAYDAWAEVAAESGQQLVVRTGGLVIEKTSERVGLDTGSRNIDGYVQTFRSHGIDFEELDAAALERRWPQFRLDGDERAIWQGDSGIVDAAKANAVHVSLARAHGATIRDHTPVREVRPTSRGVEVVTDDEVFLAERVVTAADAWTNEVLPRGTQPIPLRVTQEQVTYYSTPHLREFAPDRFPVFMWHGRHNFYGFPVYGEVATKLGQHLGGPTVTGDTRTFDPDPERIALQHAFLERHVPGFLGPELLTKTCLYTIPPDQGFVVSLLPDDPRVAVFVGAGHAFEFASLLGKVLVELVTTGTTAYPVSGLEIDRPALLDRSFRPSYHV